MAACAPCPAPINISVQMASSSPAQKRCSRKPSRASCGGGGDQACNGSRQASASGSRQSIPNYMKPLSRTPSYSARINIGGGNTCCPGHPRPDCCRVPCCEPPLPRCPVGIYAERTKSVKPNRTYEAPETKFHDLSTYREHYFLKCGERTKSFKPAKTFVPSEAPLDGLSTYREAYHCKPLVPKVIPPWSKKATFDPSGAKMEGVSQYRFDYKGCMAPRQPSFKPNKTFVPSDGKMEGLSTYRTNYIPYCPREYDYARPKVSAKPVGAPSCAPMEGLSTYRGDYYPKCMVRTNSMKPNIKPRFSDARMDGVTTYKNDYIPFHFEKCPGPCIPAQIYDECYPNPCLFGCSGDGDKAEQDEECPDPCPPNPMCCGQPKPCGISEPCGGFPYTIGNSGEQIQACCDCLNDPPPEKNDDEC
ncbi:unnamed protein product [Orchesella dallaii]|uniref:Stabilizer of axonemal microtubules 2 n=1 Tax=Orchesella dallaii TaxID=48710 RepID=A0ABP1QXQ6_9HEXA